MRSVWFLFLAFLLIAPPAVQAEETAVQTLPDPSDETEWSVPFSASGLWYADLDGLPLSLCLNTDGTFEYRTPGESTSGVWEQEDGLIFLENAREHPLDPLSEDIMLQESTGLLFTREEPEIYLPGASVPEAALEWFQGYWTSTWLDMGAGAVPAQAVGDHTDLYIEGSLVALGGRRFGDIFWNFTFENGMLSAALNDGRSLTLAFQEDSLLKLTVSGPNESTVLYLEPAWSEKLDQGLDAESAD